MFGLFYFTTFIVQPSFFCHVAFLFYISIYVLVFLTSSVCNLSSFSIMSRISLVIHLFFLFFSFCGKISLADAVSAFLSEFQLLPLSFIKASNLFCTDTAYACLISGFEFNDS